MIKARQISNKMILDDILGETPNLIDKSILSILKAHVMQVTRTQLLENSGVTSKVSIYQRY